MRASFNYIFYCMKSYFYYGSPTEFYSKIIYFIFESFYSSFDILQSPQNMYSKLNFFLLLMTIKVDMF